MKKYDIYLKGYVGGEDFDSNYVDYVLNQMEAQEVSVLINSLGGSVSTAFSIAAAFSRHGNVSVHFSGMNASAATIASIGAKHITIDKNAMYLVHKVAAGVLEWGAFNADDMQRLIEKFQQHKSDLDKIDANIATMYAQRCKKTPEQLLALMKAGGWMNAQEAMDWGFVDEITDEEEPAPALTNQLVASMQQAGIPIPNLPVQDSNSLLSAIRAMLQGFFHPTQKDKSNITNNHKPIHHAMKKVYTNICRILNVKDFDLNKDNLATLSDRQLTTLDNKIQSLTDKVSNQKNTIAQLQNTVENLKKAPGDNTNTIVNNGTNGTQQEENYSDVLQHARELFNQLP